MGQGTALYLAPIPKKLSHRQGFFSLGGSPMRYIKIEANDPQSLVPAAKKTGLNWQITLSPFVKKDEVGLKIRLDEDANIPTEGYKLVVSPKTIEITASTPAGAYYGACTLAQIVKQCEDNIPCLSINDWPDMAARGVMLDISRDKVPTMETLYQLVDLLAEWKINQLQLYTEHTFAYLAHPTVWEHASPMTGEEILALDAYCKERFVELVPNQNSFGHMTRWLIHDKYRPMAEAPNGCDTIWGYFENPFSLCPIDKRSIPFVKGLFDELLPHFSSKLLNVGCDETVDLGRGRSKKACEERGTGRVYLDFLLQIYELVKEHDKTMMFWGDIIMHHPELIPEVPKDTIALEWGYDASHPFLEHGEKFAASGIPFYVCPGTSSWNTLCGRTENALINITSAARDGLKQGAVGLLNTDWGDNGHLQPLSVSYLGYMAGAMASWNAKADLRKDLTMNLSVNAFGDKTGKIGRAFYDLGDIYRVFKKKTFNQSIPWQMIVRPLENKEFSEGLEESEFEAMHLRIREIADEARGDKMTCQDASIVREELEQVMRMLQLSADVGMFRLGGPRPKDFEARVKDVKKHHERVWLLRNRPGGLNDSLKNIRI